MTASLRLLGPVEARADGRVLSLGPRRQRLLLAILALEAGRPVEVTRLIDLAWPQGKPRTAEHAVRVGISALRGALTGLPGLDIQTRGSAYALAADPLLVDVHQFRALLAQARTAREDTVRVGLLEHALALWSGVPLAGTASEETRQRLFAGLEEHRLGALEDLFDARLRLGRHREVIADLTVLADAHPERERLAGLLMLALYRCGRQAEALAACRRTRQWLATELGLDPGTDLRRLELAILREDVSLDLPQRPSAPVPRSPLNAAVPAEPEAPALALVGRSAELSRLDDLLRQAEAGRSQCLVIRGAPGIGKSVLLEYLAARDAGLLVLRVSGVEFESELAYSGLLGLVRPLLGLLEELPLEQADALRVAFAMVSGRSVGRLAVYVATLNLLALAAERQPVLCLVDDAHWLDRASAEALLFTARRVLANGISLVFAARDVPGFDAKGIPDLTLGGLDQAAGTELALRTAGLSPRVAAGLVTATEGNPLALTELPATLTAGQRSGQVPLDQPLVTAGRVEAAFLDQVRPLPMATRNALLTCALCDKGDLDLLFRALAAEGLPQQAVDQAVEAGLVATRDGAVSFRHPLIRSAVYSAAGPGQRRAAHLSLAAALDHPDDADRRAWHLASAAVRPDEHVAEALAATAERARQRGGMVAEARALDRAAELTGDDGKRGQWLVRAAVAWSNAGAVDRAAALYDEVLRFSTDPSVRARAQGGRAYLAFSRGAGAAARDEFIAEAEAYAAGDPVAAGRLMSMALNYDAMHLNAPGILRICERAAELVSPDGPSDSYPAATVRLAYAQVMSGIRGGTELARACLPYAERTSGGTAAELAEVFIWIEEYGDAGRLLDREIAEGRSSGDILLLSYALQRLTTLSLRLGRPRSAHVAAAEAVQLAEHIGQPWQYANALANLATVEAVLGADEECRRHAGLACGAGMSAFDDVAAQAHHALGLAALAAGRLEEAAAELGWTMGKLCAGGVAEPGFLPVAADLAEACALLGRYEAATAALRWLQDAVGRTGRRGCLGPAERCRALLASGPAAEAAYCAALRLHDQAGNPVERARTLLRFGCWLLAEGRMADAAVRLREALACCEEAGLAGWARQCRAELARAAPGAETASLPAPPHEPLTTTEWQIMSLAAQGLTDGEIAERVLLTPRAVSHHLKEILRKVRAASRQELAGRLAIAGRALTGS